MRLYKALFVLSLLTILLFNISTVFANELLQARIFIDEKPQWKTIKELHLDMVWAADNYIEIITNQAELQKLGELGFRSEIVHPDIVSFYQSRLDISRDMGGYKTLDEINDYLDTIIANHRDIVSDKISIGQTIEGRDIWAVKISDNPDIDEDEPEVLYTAAIHAREVITPEVLFFFMDELTDKYGFWPDETEIVNSRELWFIMVANPDGYFHNEAIAPNGGGMWRKNRRNNGDGTYGVDLNRNFGYEWGRDDIGSSPYTDDQTYRGTAPFSEPETQALRDFISSRQFIITVYYHSYSNLILYPWGYDYLLTPDNDIFVFLGDSINAFNGYTPGPVWSLYIVNGGSDDWGYGEQVTKNKNLSITPEVGSYDDGFWPPLYRIEELVTENLAPNKFLAMIAGTVYSIRPPNKPVLFVADTVDSYNYNVYWSLDDTLNPAVNYELIELQNLSRVIDSANNFDNWTNNEFLINSFAWHSPSSCFYSGSGDGLFRYFQSKEGFYVNAGDSLKFWTNYNIETDWDYAYVEISTDGLNYITIPGNITTDYNPYGNNRGNGITGTSGNWVEGLFDLSAFEDQFIYIRFTYMTDGYVAWDGIYIDDIFPVDVFEIESVISSAITDTVYNFTGKPVGEYYYKVRAEDADSQWSSYSNTKMTYAMDFFVCIDSDNDGYGDPGHPENDCLEDNCPTIFNPDQLDSDNDGLGDICDACENDPDNDIDNDSICGDVDNCPSTPNTLQEDSDSDGVGDVCDNCPEVYNPDQIDTDLDGEGDICECCQGIRGNIDNDAEQNINIADLVYLVDFMFSSPPGPAPPCPEEADVNNFDNLDIADLVYMVDYMFNTPTGPQPEDCF
ncbi:MAG: M14 family zinc carboxypeptidase [Candidatus Zixiibacteriota bacterium]